METLVLIFAALFVAAIAWFELWIKYQHYKHGGWFGQRRPKRRSK
jgi:hypothetical protein